MKLCFELREAQHIQYTLSLPFSFPFLSRSAITFSTDMVDLGIHPPERCSCATSCSLSSQPLVAVCEFGGARGLGIPSPLEAFQNSGVAKLFIGLGVGEIS